MKIPFITESHDSKAASSHSIDIEPPLKTYIPFENGPISEDMLILAGYIILQPKNQHLWDVLLHTARRLTLDCLRSTKMERNQPVHHGIPRTVNPRTRLATEESLTHELGCDIKTKKGMYIHMIHKIHC